VTIALGILAAGGTVIAADRQQTEGTAKSNRGKVSAAWKAGRGCIVLSGAGDGPPLDAIADEFREWFRADGTPLNDTDIDAEIRRRHEEFYHRYVLPFSAYADYESPDYELLVAASLINSSHGLWTSSKLVVNNEELFAAVGVGATAANALLNKFYVPTMPIEIAISLAAYVVYQVKQTVDGVGFETDMYAIINHAPFAIGGEEISEMETHFRSYEKAARSNLYYCLGGDPAVPDSFFGLGEDRESRDKAIRQFFEKLNAKRIERWHPQSPRHG
jgi:hypothetical protein